ncbi:MAG: hypothetical protein JWR24_3724 [Actinoallomurus sp.]|nr:hypothetical protein [Actinoallomurus sp.]
MILVTGATGNVGRHVVGGLVEAGADVRALSRDPSTADLPAGVEVAETGAFPLGGVTTLFLNPAVVGGGVGPLLKKAADEGVRRIVLLSSASTLDDDRDNAIAVRHRTLEREIEESRLEWTFLRPGAFASNTLQWAARIRSTGVVRAAYGRAGIAPIHERDIAHVAVRALLHDDLMGATPVLTGPQSVTLIDQVHIIGDAIGRSLRFEEMTPEVAREEMVAGHVPPAIADTLLGMFAAFEDRQADVSPDVETITGRPARTFAEWAADNAAAFR